VITGSADVEALARRAPTLADFATEPLALSGVETLQVLCEISRAGADALVPPGLHPTIPPIVTFLVQRAPDSPWGPFTLAQTRIGCRSGLRPRGFLRAGVIDNKEAAAALAARWGYGLLEGDVELLRGYDRVRARVELAGEPVLDVSLADPSPLGTNDIHYVASMHLAHTPNGLRLVQVDPDYDVERAERGDPGVSLFDAAAWRSEGLEPGFPVSACFSVATLTLPALRYVCDPEVLAFTGTERVDA
jgi:hypothetical protein